MIWYYNAGVERSSSSHRPSIRNKPMDKVDFEKVEVDLQHQLQSGRIQSNNLAQMQDYALQGNFILPIST